MRCTLIVLLCVLSCVPLCGCLEADASPSRMNVAVRDLECLDLQEPLRLTTAFRQPASQDECRCRDCPCRATASERPPVEREPAEPVNDQRPTVTVYSPPWCGICEAMERQVEGDGRFRFVFVKDEREFPAWLPDWLAQNGGGYPVLHWNLPDGRSLILSGWYGLEHFAAVHSPPPVQPAMRSTRPPLVRRDYGVGYCTTGFCR